MLEAKDWEKMRFSDIPQEGKMAAKFNYMKRDIPANLQNFLNSEEVLFKVYSRRKMPWARSRQLPMAGLVWLIVNIFFLEGTSDIGFGGINTFSLMTIFFLLVGFVLIGIGVYQALQEGGWMIGLKDRLVRYHKGRMNSYTWSQFTGNMEIDSDRGNLLLELRSGTMVKGGKHGGQTFVPDSVFLAGVDGVLNIEKICRERIGKANGFDV